MIGEHTVTVAPLDGGDPIDLSCLVDQVAVVHGRDNTTGQPEASTTTVDLTFDTTRDDLDPAVEIGAVLRVVTTLNGVDSARFAGPITDLVLGWEDAGRDTPNAATMQILAAGPLAALGRRIVGDAPFPVELDGARVARVLALAGIVLDPGTSDPGTVQILARDVDAQPALELAQSAAASASGILWQTRAGDIRYADAEHRRGTLAALSLDACDVLVTPTWRRDTAGLVNAVSIGYGPTPEDGGEQPRYIASAPTSQARYGRAEYSTATVLAALADAEAMGLLLLTRNAAPVWLLQELPVDLDDLDAPTSAAVLALDMHDLVAVTGMPVIGALPSSTSLWVEGWSETLAAGVHDLALFVSGYCRTSPPPRWNDLDPALSWDQAAGTWDAATCLGPMPSLGRWDDTPASTRWDSVPAATTWDTWKG